MFLVTSGNKWLTYKCFPFSGGEVSVKLDPEETSFIHYPSYPFDIKAHITSPSQIMELCLLVDALRQSYGNMNISLDCPYLPYARQDRVCAQGESLSLKVFANIINSLNFKTVTVSDVHSDVSLALINNVRNIPVEYILSPYLRDFYKIVKPILVAPDAGSIKKVLKVAQKFNLEMVRADKIRNVETGEIKDTVVYTDHLGKQSVLVVDDICDGGRTFIELGKELKTKTNGNLSLYVTHGIFSKGLDELLVYYDKIYCPYVFPNVTPHERLIRQ
jgi:ribose-phosphate pyrophosphokinase